MEEPDEISLDEGDLPDEEFDYADADASEQGPDEGDDFAAGPPEPPQEAEGRPLIFISYHATRENYAVASRLKHELGDQYEVFIDRDLTGGSPWESDIPEKLCEADFVIALLSEDFASRYTTHEIDTAYKLYEQHRKPTIIPVRMEYAGSYGFTLDASLRRFQVIPWQDTEDFSYVLKELRDALSGKREAEDDKRDFGLGGYLTDELRKKLFRAAHIHQPWLGRAVSELVGKKLVWLTGESGVRNYAALSLAVMAGADSIYEISSSRSWSDIDRTGIHNSSIIFTDALPAAHFKDETSFKELAALSNMLGRDNSVIATSAKDAFQEAGHQMRRWGFKSCHQAEVALSSYNDEDKRHIFEKMVENFADSAELNERQAKWARKLFDGSGAAVPSNSVTAENRRRLAQVVTTWTPDDIVRFVLRSLPRAKGEADIGKFLLRNATLDEEIRSWFFSLDDSIKCFVLTAALFAGYDRKRFWEKYAEVFANLRAWDGKLSIWPIGICRQRAAPYVTADGPIDFVNARVADAVRVQISKNYREYLIGLKDEMKRWSGAQAPTAQLASHGGQKRGQVAEKTDGAGIAKPRATGKDRAAMARMVGVAARLSVDDFSDLIESWGKVKKRSFREAVSVALENMVRDTTSAHHALRLLGRWLSRPDADADDAELLLTAITTIRRIAPVLRGSPSYAEAMRHLELIAVDRRYTRFRGYLSRTLNGMVRSLPLEDLSGLLEILARDRRYVVRIRNAESLNEAQLNDNQEVPSLYARWAYSEDEALRWGAVCSLIIRGNRPQWKRQRELTYEEIQRFVADDGEVFADALFAAIKDKDERVRDSALTTLYQLARRYSNGSESGLVSALAARLRIHRDDELLDLLRGSHRQRLARLVVEIRCEMWKILLDSPADFLAEVAEGLEEEPTDAEAYEALKLLFETEPAGRVVETLAECYVDEDETLEGVLNKLSNCTVQSLHDIPLQVRLEAFNRLLGNPAEFVHTAFTDARNEEIVKDIFWVLCELAGEGANGRRDELTEAILQGYNQDPQEAGYILRVFTYLGERGQMPARFARSVRSMLLEKLLSNPSRFISELQRAEAEGPEWKETLHILRDWMTPGEHSNKDVLVSVLAAARAGNKDAVNSLLRRHLGFGMRLRVMWKALSG